jgi:tetratricopeptide (TPR) repeat protein
MKFFQGLAQRDPGNPEVHYAYGASLAVAGMVDPAVAEFEKAIQIEPDYGQPYYSAYYTLRTVGQRERALQYLQRWVDSHPNDTQAMGVLQAERAELGIRQSPNTPPPGVNVP